MKQFGIKLQTMVLGAAYGVMCSSPVYAEDIEIYSSKLTTSSIATSNILFVLDTSGSMDGLVTTSPSTYDPSKVYSGCFDAARLYTDVSFTSQNISGTDYTGPEMYCIPEGPGKGYTLANLDQFNDSAFKCDAATSSLASAGFYIDRIAQYRTTTTSGGGGWGWGWGGGGGSTTSTSWVSVNGIDDGELTAFVECKADQGIHGQTAGDGKPYATDDPGGWQSGSSGSIDWSSFFGAVGSTETVHVGNYLNFLVSEPPVITTRLQAMKNALTDVINASSGINVGLMRYSKNANGGLVVTPMGDVATVKTDFLYELSKMYHAGGTPLEESFYEAVLYMQGKNVDYGDSSTVQQYKDPVADGLIEEVSRKSHSGSRTSAGSSVYKSPISDTCQKNYIVMLTDGKPSYSDSLSASQLSTIGVSRTCDAVGTNSCLEEIAGAIGSSDQSSLIGKQVISTFTIGLDIASAEDLLKGTATASKTASGTGNYYAADNATALTDAFSKIVRRVLETDSTFSSPAVSVNAFNRATHLDDLYFTLFKPGENLRWVGNFKKYKLRFSTDPVTGEREPFIAGQGDVAAIDPATGFFTSSAVSYWTDTAALKSDGKTTVGPDGAEVGAGGAVSVMTNTRNIYTITGNYTDTNGVFAPDTGKLSAAVNAVDTSNTALTEGLLDVAGTADIVTGKTYRETVIEWANGLDVFDANANGKTDDVYRSMGDPLHSEPALVQYGGTVTKPDLVAFTATNDGYLHAFDVDDGKELFSFIPQELLRNLPFAMENNQTGKLYGLDGNVVAWVYDKNGDNKIDATDDHVYLYIGMRRGGRNIYALDVTVRADPKLLWVIKGGEGDYAELAQTWSSINVEKIKDGADEKTVLIFGGGYDPDQDNAAVRTPDDAGRAVFIADAKTGERLWVGGLGGDTAVSEMGYSIPARVKPLDISGDGFIDRLYAVDMGGQVFRFDIDNTNSTALSGSVTGGRIADLAGSVAEDARRFFYPPDVALVDDPSGKYHGLILSSGYRAHPLDKVIHDRIYMLKDKQTGLATTLSTDISDSKLKDVTANLAGGDGGTGTTGDAARSAELKNIQGKEGWYINLDEASTGNWVGEKGLAEPLIIEGTAVITTYIPDFTTSSGSCSPKAGFANIYFLDVLDATPAFPQDIDKRAQRSVVLKRGGIPPSPNVIITKGGEPTLCVGTECQKADFGLGVRKTYWYEVE